jgi:hypothetical protein
MDCDAVCKKESSAGRAKAILSAPRQAVPASDGTGLRGIADPMAAVVQAIVHAGVREFAVMRGCAEGAVTAVTTAEFANGTAMP